MDLDRILIDLLSDKIVAALKARATHGIVLFSDTDLGLEPALSGLEGLRAKGWTMEWQAAPAFRDMLAPRLPFAEAPAQVQLVRAGLVLVPTLSLSLAAKVATGIADDPQSALLGEALDRGLRIVAARDGVCPGARDRAARGLTPQNPARRALMSGHLESLAAQGVELCWAARLAHTVLGTQEAAAPAAVAQDTGIFGWQQARAYGAPVLRLGRAVLLTPLAADILAARGIAIERE
ncbi:hypothetical protein C8J27_11032 [Rhodobacter aestuarii]|uniref:Uncharacterized protein n=1 Tax=Rhodobacter aestuarii TaxID=453582 RepID=A0A1N7PZX2_9RHOB|nr:MULTISPECIES: hypothetical protein [Rhodobacter]PTV93982.1 hypothetical protein C8J27_11032 [Rhodobacter aestuarii]SIT16131.1 hypothetical protein SAMN05421580_11232 [Rhodobacter aestuarii]SOC20464.1 hypothetical protein SAMN05877809_11221 [Rhodobacter sp. JA431]